MRIAIAAALCVALAGCVTSEPPPPPGPPPGYNPEHDAHCRSLLMAPGSLVYVQCRLAMSQTQRRAETAARALLTQNLGFVSPEADSALRDDIFCNYNESSKLSVEQVTPADGALTAYGRCATTRNRLQRQIRSDQPMQAEAAIMAYDQSVIVTNEATITEARTFH